MRKLLLMTVALSTVVFAPHAIAADQTVTVSRAGFVPPAVTIETGDRVTWNNTDTVQHRVVVENFAPCNLTIPAGESRSCRFTTAGRFTYRDPGQTAPTFSGTVTVQQAGNQLTLAVSRRTVIFGGSITLSGAVTPTRANQVVTVRIRPMGEPEQRVTVRTDSAGRYTYRHQPRILTVYAATSRGAESTTQTVSVRPRVSLRKVGARRFQIVVVAAQSLAGRRATISRVIGRGAAARLRRVARVTLRQNPRTDTISQRTFTLRVRRGWKLRAFTPAVPGYIAGQSNFIVV
jgi:plastocyanin